MKQGKTLVQLAQALTDNAESKRDFVADARDLTMKPDDASIAIAGDVEPMQATDHCHKQIASWTGIGTRYYQKMREDSPALLAGNVNHWMHQDRDKPARRLVRTLDGKARAFLSDRYLRLDNEHIAETAFAALSEVPEISIASCDVTDKKLYIKAVFPKTEREVKVGDAVQSGVVISNSEIGAGSFQVTPFWYRLWCTNGCASMVNGAGLRRAHLGRQIQADGIEYQQDTIAAAAKATLLECRDAVTQFADPDYFQKQVDAIRATTDTTQAVRPVRAVEELGKLIGLNESEQESVLERFIRDQDMTQYGMLNAVTNLANDTESYDRASELESLGGRVLTLNPNQWERIALAA